MALVKTITLWELSSDEFDRMNEFLDWVENNEYRWVIYVNSEWGSIWVYDSLISRMNELSKSIELRGIFLASAAFDLLYNFIWTKRLEKDAEWVIHATALNADVFVNANWTATIRSNSPYKRQALSLTQYNYSFLSDDENLKIQEWYDIVLNYNRLIEILNNQTRKWQHKKSPNTYQTTMNGEEVTKI